MEGRVWVDNPDNPTFSVVWNEYQQGFQLMGEPLKESEYINLRLFFDTVIGQMLREKGLEYFECGCDNKELTNMLYGIFQNKKIDSEEQKVFSLQQFICPAEGLLTIHDGYDIVAIDASFFTREYVNLEYVTREINATWISLEDYLMNGYGYAAVMDNYIVSRALVTCCYKLNDNIGVDTKEEHRRKGLSAKLVYMTLLEAKRRGRDCIWDCMEENVASESTALKVGFVLERTYTVCWFGLDQ
jgi:GNAT superfamily N-acetyltransferase